MKTVRIFLASSINEFAGLRDRLTVLIESYNHHFAEKGYLLRVERCETMDRSFSADRKQEEINQTIRECDFFFLLAGKDVGDATREEFDEAYRQLRDKGGPAKLPRIRVFFQNYAIEETTPKLRRFREYIRDTLGQYPDKFSHTSEVERDIQTELADSGLLFDPFGFEERKRRIFEILLRIRRNRKEISALSKDGVNLENLLEVATLYANNKALSEEYGVEWRTFYEYACFLQQQGDRKRAIEVAAQLDAHYNPADDPAERADLKLLLGKWRMEADEYEAAEEYFQSALDLYRPLSQKKKKYSPNAAETCVRLAEVMEKTYRVRAAERLYREALERYLSRASGDPKKYAFPTARTCHSLRERIAREPNRTYEADILQQGERAYMNYGIRRDESRLASAAEELSRWLEQYPCPDEAVQYIRQAEAQARELTQDKPEDYDQALAWVCWHIGKHLREHNRMEEAETLSRKLLELFQDLAGKDPATHTFNVAACLRVLGMTLAYTNRPAGAERLYHQAIAIFDGLAEQNPVMKQDAAIGRNNLANLLHNTGRLRESEELHREALAVCCELAKEDPDAEEYVAHSCNNLAETLREIGETGEAELLYREALQIRRRFAARDPDKEQYVAATCNGLGILMTETGRTGEAERCYGEALKIGRRLAEEDPSRYEPDLATSCYNFGTFLATRKQDRPGARKYYEEAISLWEKYPHFEKWLEKARHNRSLCL